MNEKKTVSQISACSGCPFREKFPTNTFVKPTFGTGNRLVLAEAPGEQEALEGAPLVGGSGRLFDSLLAKARIKRETLTIANCLQCRPPENVFPTDPEARSYISKEDAEKTVAHCYNAHVKPLLKGKNWSRVDLLGDKPLRIIAGKEGGISKYRGSPVAIPEIDPDKLISVPTFHPSYLMRDQTMFPIAVNDLQKSLKPPPEFYNLYPSLDEVKSFKATDFAFDIETTREWDPKIKIVGLCAKPYEVIVVPFQGAYVEELRRVFRNAKLLVSQNGVQFDEPVLEANGVPLSKGAKTFDVMLAHHLRFPNMPHDLEFIGSMFSSKPCWKDLIGENFNLYNARDTDITFQAYLALKPLLEEAKLMEIHDLISVPLGKICRVMTRQGFKIDPSRIGKVRQSLLEEQTRLEQDLPEQMRTYKVATRKRELAPLGTLSEKTGKPVKYIFVADEEKIVPWRSTPKKLAFLYGKDEVWQLGFDTMYDPKSGRISSGKIVLDKLIKRAAAPEAKRAIVAIKRLNALDELLTNFCKEDLLKKSRVHPSFNVHGTSSGRLSSSDPNIQNQPEVIRHIYVPDTEEMEIMSVDFSQLENRLTAHLAGDKRRLERFEKDPDFSEHKFACSKFIGVPYEQVVKDNSREAPYGQAKVIVHGTNYLMGPQKIANTYDLDLKQTKVQQAIWKDEIRDSIRWQTARGEEAKREGFLTNPFKRKGWFWTSSYATEAASFTPQSTGFDIIARCMIALMYERIGWPVELVKKVVRVFEPLPKGADLLAQVHDELVFQHLRRLRDEVARIVTRVMTQPWPELGGLSIPIGIKVGGSWGECEGL